MNKNLLRRFGGSIKAIEQYCSDSSKPTIHELNAAYAAADRPIVYGTAPKVAHKRPHNPKHHKLGRR